MNIYEKFPTLENDNFLLRAVEEEDCADLLEVYSDKNALPFFNSDNCNGDNFYYSTKERMTEAVLFWKEAYKNGWFVRWAIADKTTSKVIGTIELCTLAAEGAFNNMGILRIDVKSDYEKEKKLFDIFSLITTHSFELIGCSEIITKAPIYAIERINAVKKDGFIKSDDPLIGNDGYAYNGYWIKKQK